ncbi:MAG: DUF3793 family protein [bacterium]|nr:DUF3793 family protein [bacterium]
MLEKQFIEQCAPTLASLKTGSLFTFHYQDEKELQNSVREWDEQMSEKGIAVSILRTQKHMALIYVYRPSRLKRDMSRPETENFLRQCGYKNANPDSALRILQKKLQEEEGFPHEIGLFLGYPLEDVIGFIVNAGRNSLVTGYWKVYANVNEAMETFAKYKKCRAVYERLWKEGRSVWQLTVAA